MDDQEIESLLGAYALDAVEGDEAREIERHLLECPRCRAELAAHRDVATLLANTGAEAPRGLWEKIASELDGETALAKPNAMIAKLRRPPASRRRLLVPLAAAAAIAIAVLGVEVANLDSQVHHLQTPVSDESLAPAVAAVMEGPHTTIELTSATTSASGEIVATSRNGTAYWVGSDLRSLSSGETYQLWGLTKSGRIVSLGLLGSDANRYSAFRLEHATTKLMVTAEPAGGTAEPTTAVLVAADVPNAV